MFTLLGRWDLCTLSDLSALLLSFHYLAQGLILEESIYLVTACSQPHSLSKFTSQMHREVVYLKSDLKLLKGVLK